MKKLLFILILFCSLQGFGQIKGYWRLDGNSNDASGNGNDGTDANITYSQSNGVLNQGAGFNGSTSKIVVGPRTSLGSIGTNPFTISLFFKLTNPGINQWLIRHWGITTANPRSQVNISVVNNTLQAYIYDTNSRLEANPVSNITISAGKKYHVVLVRNGTSHKLYVNGIFNVESTTSSAILCWRTTNHQTIFGFVSPETGFPVLNGGIDECIIENSAWSAAKVKNEYIRMLGAFSN